MNTTKTIDVKGMDHTEKEGLIFPGVEGLREGETLRIVLEFNPVPLVYLLKSQDKYDIAFEKEGPDEWILNVTRIVDRKAQKQQFKELLAELKDGQASVAVKEKARTLFQDVDATSLGLMEQELIREGVSHEEIRKSLCDIHLEAMKDSLVAKRIEVAAPHPVHTLMEEHVVILENLKALGAFVERLKEKKSFEDMGQDVEQLKDIAHHLIEAESHHQREEEALFPEMEKHDITEPPNIMKMDHIEFRKRKQQLYQLALHPEEHDFTTLKERVIELGEYLVRELDSHIFKENNILYQIALQVLSPDEWDRIKSVCDKIGYCCFTPEDQKEGDMIELDLRQIMPFERHEIIFEKWNALKTGEILKLINDHDPKPLHYQFEAEYKDKYRWEYEQDGPKDWIVRITRLKD